MYVVKAAKTTFIRKTRAYNVDEIDSRRGGVRDSVTKSYKGEGGGLK